MTDSYIQVSRKTVKEDRVAICPYFGCMHLEKVKPLKFGFIGRRKYPKCSKHKIYLVFVDKFIGNFIQAIEACLNDISGLPPDDLIIKIKNYAPNSLEAFINSWIYCNPVGRGAQIVSHYMEGLSRGYIKLLSRKQRKAIQHGSNQKKRYDILRFGLKKIADEYKNFLQNLRKESEERQKQQNSYFLTEKVRNIIHTWLNSYLNTIQLSNEKGSKDKIQPKSLVKLKAEYDKILHIGTCTLLIGKSPEIVIKGISAFELFSTYHEFLKAGLCRNLMGEDIQRAIKVNSIKEADLERKSLITPVELESISNYIKLNINSEDFLLSESEILEVLSYYLELKRSKIMSNDFDPDKFKQQLESLLSGLIERLNLPNEFYIRLGGKLYGHRKIFSINQKIALFLGQSINYLRLSEKKISFSSIESMSLNLIEKRALFQASDQKNVKDALNLMKKYSIYRLQNESEIRSLFLSLSNLFKDVFKLETFSERELSRLLYGNPNKFSSFYVTNRQNEIGVLFELEYRISRLIEHFKEDKIESIVNETGLKLLISKSKTLIRFYLLENGYIVPKGWRTFHFLWDMSYAKADDVDLINMKGKINIIFQLERFNPMRLRKGSILSRNKIVQFKKIVKQFKNTQSKTKFMETYKFYKNWIGNMHETLGRSRYIGRLSHDIIEKVVERFLLDKDKQIHVESEKMINYPQSKHQIDNIFNWVREYFKEDILIKSNVQNLSHFPAKIKKICVDYTIVTDPNNLGHAVNKIYKNYQSDENYLLIVLYGPMNVISIQGIKDSILEADKCPYKEHISILTIQEFINFIRLKNNALVHLNNLQQRVEEAIKSYDYLKKFENFYDNFDYDNKAKLLQPKITDFSK